MKQRHVIAHLHIPLNTALSESSSSGDQVVPTSAATTISGWLIHHVGHLYEMALERIVQKKGVRHGINGAARYGHSAYILSVVAVEAFINEAYLGEIPRLLFKNSPLWNLSTDWLERLELQTKLILVPQLLFGESFDSSAQPHQDMATLIRVRNDLVHYKMQVKPPKYIKALADTKVLLGNPRAQIDGSDYLWPDKLNCSEGIRWAHNTACKVVHTMAEHTDERLKSQIKGLVSNFAEISESDVLLWFEENGIDPASHEPAVIVDDLHP